jgi:hypothetical protein
MVKEAKPTRIVAMSLRKVKICRYIAADVVSHFPDIFLALSNAIN